MKRLFAAFAFILLLAGITATGIYFVNDYTGQMDDLLIEAEDAARAGDTHTAISFCQQAEAYWVKAEKVLSLFINHSDVSQVGQSCTRLAPLIEEGETGEFFASVRTIRVQLIHIASMETFSVS